MAEAPRAVSGENVVRSDVGCRPVVEGQFVAALSEDTWMSVLLWGGIGGVLVRKSITSPVGGVELFG